MRTRTIKKTAMVFFLTLTAYLTIGHLLHKVIFPEQKPSVYGWFKPGQEIYSKAEGFRQIVVKHENGYVHCTTEIEPYAGGPPKHIHTGFDETLRVENGELTVWVDGVIRKIRPGEVLHIPKGTPHKPYNETADTVKIKGAVAFPEHFAFCLSQAYGVLDNQPEFIQSPKAILQMPLWHSSGFDSYAAEGPPVFMQKLMGFVVAPLSRLLGYRSYYPQYDPTISPKK